MNSQAQNAFRFSTQAQEGNLQVSKWLHIQVLLDDSEMEKLFEELGEFYIISVGKVLNKQNALISHKSFIQTYASYIEEIKAGKNPKEIHHQSNFSVVFAKQLEDFYAIDVSEKTMLVRPTQPVVQVQAHFMGFSPVDEQLRPMVRTIDCIPWGLQFSYPLIYQEPKKGDVYQALKDERFVNRLLFQTIQKWMRLHSRATPFMHKDRRFVVPMRLGHQCFAWVNNHPMLHFHGLLVDSEGDEG